MYWVEGDFHGSYNEEDIVGDLEKDFAGEVLRQGYGSGYRRGECHQPPDVLLSFLTDNTQSLSGKRSYATWQQGYLQIFDYVRENKSFIKHVYYSEGREILTRFLYDITYKLLLGVIDERAEGIVVDEEDKAFIAHFYKYGFVGMVLEWIESGMKEEPKRLISHLDILTHGDIDKALGRFRTDRKLDIELRRG